MRMAMATYTSVVKKIEELLNLLHNIDFWLVLKEHVFTSLEIKWHIKYINIRQSIFRLESGSTRFPKIIQL